MTPPTVDEAIETIKEYPEVEMFIDANYAQRMAPGFGMDDNSIELSWYWHECYKLVNPTTNDTNKG